MPSKVYFTRNITPENVLKLYEACGLELSGNVAVKLHSGAGYFAEHWIYL